MRNSHDDASGGRQRRGTLLLRPLALLTVLMFALSGCMLVTDLGVETLWIIPAGAHYPEPHPFLDFVRGNTLEFSFRFDDSAIYDLGTEDQHDINKLFGFAEGSALHIHEHSARFGWRWLVEEEQIEIMGYAYTGGIRKSIRLGTVVPGEDAEGSITSTSDEYRFTFKDSMFIITRETPYQADRKFLSYPYFGGNVTAPHEVRIAITLLDCY